jgi:hypothetical protein
MQEIWSAALATCPSAITPASHVLSQLLVPGQLCVSTLVQALDLHGARVSEQEVAASSLQQLQVGGSSPWQPGDVWSPMQLTAHPAACLRAPLIQYCVQYCVFCEVVEGLGADSCSAVADLTSVTCQLRLLKDSQ